MANYFNDRNRQRSAAARHTDGLDEAAQYSADHRAEADFDLCDLLAGVSQYDQRADRWSPVCTGLSLDESRRMMRHVDGHGE